MHILQLAGKIDAPVVPAPESQRRGAVHAGRPHAGAELVTECRKLPDESRRLAADAVRAYVAEDRLAGCGGVLAPSQLPPEMVTQLVHKQLWLRCGGRTHR
eukprot:7324119-Prymnesium_polylepis.1